MGGSPCVNSSPLLDLVANSTLDSRIFTLIGSFLDTKDVLHLMKTSKQMYCTIREILWDINRSLARYVDHPLRFRDKLASCDALISGFFAVQFFARQVWANTELDIFVKSGFRAWGFAKYLQEEEGYARTKTKGILKVALIRGDVQDIETFAKEHSGAKPSRINIFRTSSLPIVAMLYSCYTTAMVNVITSRKAHSIFPLPTFLHYKSYDLKSNDNICLDVLRDKYLDRGWVLEGILKNEDDSNYHPIRKHRFIGDSRSWALSLPTAGISPPNDPDLVLEMTEFKMDKEEGDEEGDEASYVIRTGPIDIHLLKCRYVSPAPLHCTFYKFVKHMIQITEEKKWIRKMEGAKRVQVKASFHRFSGDVYDDHLLIWWNDWIRVNGGELQREPEFLKP